MKSILRFWRKKPKEQTDMPTLARFLRYLWVVIVMLTATGCEELLFDNARSMPAPLRDDFPYVIDGKAVSKFGGKSFQLYSSGKLHFIVLYGIVTPARDHAFYWQAKRAFQEMIRQKPVRVNVVQRDSHHREIGFVFCSSEQESTDEDHPDDLQLDVGLQLIRLGLAQYDGADFENANHYRTAETEARRDGRGFWGQADRDLRGNPRIDNERTSNKAHD